MEDGTDGTEGKGEGEERRLSIKERKVEYRPATPLGGWEGNMCAVLLLCVVSVCVSLLLLCVVLVPLVSTFSVVSVESWSHCSFALSMATQRADYPGIKGGKETGFDIKERTEHSGKGKPRNVRTHTNTHGNNNI